MRAAGGEELAHVMEVLKLFICLRYIFRRGQHRFDAGPSLWAGMSEPGTNPLRQILDVVEEEVRKGRADGMRTSGLVVFATPPPP